jgi:cytochrome b6-f complex iron-sulfur subunit
MDAGYFREPEGRRDILQNGGQVAFPREARKGEATMQGPSQQKEPVSRRTFLDWFLSMSLVATALGFFSTFIAYLWPREVKSGGSETMEVGPVEELPEGEGKVVKFGNTAAIVIHTREEGIVAFSAVCTHLGCIVKWEKERYRIFCPCHAGVFDTKGNVVSGPPPKPLPRIPVAVVRGKIMLGPV